METFAVDVVSLEMEIKGEKIHLFPINWTFNIYQNFLLSHLFRPYLQ